MRKKALLLFIVISTGLYSQTEIQDTTGVTERIRTIQTMLDESKNAVNIWWYGWLGAYSVATIGQGAACLLSQNTATRQDMILGAGTTILGAVFQLITPLDTGQGAEQLSAMPENTQFEKLLKLKIAEDFLKNYAMKEQEGRSWKIHALNTVVNLGSGLITWLGYKRSVWDGVANFAINTAITETQIWTQPTRTLRDYKKYTQKYLNKENEISYRKGSELFVKTYPGGISILLRF